MRLVVWNANMALHKNLDAVMDELGPDVAVIPECANQQTLATRLARDRVPWSSMLWAGRGPHKGVGLFAFGDYRLGSLPTFEPPLEWVVPAAVTGPTTFTLLGVWAMNERASNRREFPLTNPQPAAALESEAFLGPIIMAGDFNHNVFWNEQYPQGQRHTRTLIAAERAGLVSAYHQARSEAQGAETEQTFFRRGRGSGMRPHHIDYAFLPAEWLPRLTSVTVGSEQDWVLSGRSDHVPVIVDIADPPTGYN